MFVGMKSWWQARKDFKKYHPRRTDIAPTVWDAVELIRRLRSNIVSAAMYWKKGNDPKLDNKRARRAAQAWEDRWRRQLQYALIRAACMRRQGAPVE